MSRFYLPLAATIGCISISMRFKNTPLVVNVGLWAATFAVAYFIQDFRRDGNGGSDESSDDVRDLTDENTTTNTPLSSSTTVADKVEVSEKEESKYSVPSTPPIDDDKANVSDSITEKTTELKNSATPEVKDAASSSSIMTTDAEGEGTADYKNETTVSEDNTPDVVVLSNVEGEDAIEEKVDDDAASSTVADETPPSVVEPVSISSTNENVGVGDLPAAPLSPSEASPTLLLSKSKSKSVVLQINSMSAAIEKESSSMTPKASSFIRPKSWVDDDHSHNCKVCSKKFSLLNRRHHCRQCGQLVCDPCSARRFLLPNVDKVKEVRVCDKCYSKLAILDNVGGDDNPTLPVKLRPVSVSVMPRREGVSSLSVSPASVTLLISTPPDGSSDDEEDDDEEEVTRKFIFLEILNTEKAYVNDLDVLVSEFVNPLTEAAKTKKPIITMEEIDTIFSVYINTILSVNKELLNGLVAGQRRASGHDVDLEKKEVPATSSSDDISVLTSDVAKAFCDIMPYFSMYSEYCNGCK